MNAKEAARIVAVIIAACPSQSMRLDASRVTSIIETYASLLSDIAYDDADRALRVLLQTRTWMPSVADIRQTVAEIKRGPVASGGDAWGSVLNAIAAKGAYREPGTDFSFVDPVTARCVAALGWRNLCLSENQIADRARFIELYDQLATQQRREHVSPILAEARERRTLGETILAITLGLPDKANKP